MPVQTSKISSAKFKSLVSTVLKFPPSSAVSTSEIVNFAVNMGRARVSIAGIVTSAAAVLATGEIDAFSVDYRVLAPFAEICGDGDTVSVELSRKEKQVRLLCGEHRLVIPLTFGTVLKKPKPTDTVLWEVTAETAKIIKWLASIAEKDEAKPDMSCVYIRNGAAMAGNQKCIAVSKHDSLPAGEFALPLDMCSALEDGDKITQVDNGFVVVSGCGAFAVPYQSASIKFPHHVVERLSSNDGESYATCDAQVLAAALKESIDCVARVPKVDAVVRANFEDGGKMRIRALTGTADYTTVVSATVKKTGELIFPLVEASAAVAVFDGAPLTLRQLLPKHETAIDGGSAKVFFAPITLKGQ